MAAIDDFKKELIPLIKKFEEETNQKIIRIRYREPFKDPETLIIETRG